MKKFLFCVLLVSFSCKPNPDTNSNIDVILEKSTSSEIAFDESYNTLLLSSLQQYYPNYYKGQLKSFGIKEEDSIIISTLNTDFRKFKYDLFKKGYLQSTDYSSLRIDSMIEKNKPEQKQFIVEVSFENGKQVIRVDVNGNNNFSDERKVFFPNDFRIGAIDRDKINNLPTYDLNYWSYHNNEISYFNRKVIVYPHSNYPKFPYTENVTENKSRLVLKFKDYWIGNFDYQNENYEIFVQGGNSLYSSIIIKHDSITLSNNDPIFNTNFSFKVKDTIKIHNDFFVIDSLNNSISNLFLKKVDVTSNSFYSDKIGYNMKDFRLKDLDNRDLKLSQIGDEKTDYILLDFWGTWCKPCLDFIPQLKGFSKNSKDEVTILSIALDNDIDDVKAYASDNEMDWHHAFVNRKNRSKTIIDQLSIKHYPTYILLDKNRKILYRGVGESAFEKIKEIINP